MPRSGSHAELLRRGRNLFHGGQMDDAAEAFADCLHAYPESVGAMSGLGFCYSHLGRHERASDLFRRASELRPRSPAVLFAKGLVFERAGDRTESRSSFELVLELDPAHADADRHLRRLDKPARPAAEDEREPEIEREFTAAPDARVGTADMTTEAAEAEADAAEAVEEAVEADAVDAEADAVEAEADAIDAEADAIEAEAADLGSEAAAVDDADNSFDVDDAVTAEIAEAEADVLEEYSSADAETEVPPSETPARSRRQSASERWPSIPASPLETGDAWGGLKVADCDDDRLVLKGARNITFQKEAPNVVEKAFFGLSSKKRSAEKWQLVRIIIKVAAKKTPEKAVLEFVDRDGETRLTLPGGRTSDSKAVLGIRAAVHLARMFNLDVEVQGEPADGDEELTQLIESLGA